jgi:hypothetical protein
MFNGIGIVNPGSTGITTGGAATCVTAAELAEAKQKCADQNAVRGLGHPNPMGGRFTGVDPCSLYNLPVCPAPTCIDEGTALTIASYLQGQNLPADEMAWLKNGGGSAYFFLPYCSRPAALGPIPDCLTPDAYDAVQYCKTHGMNGPNKNQNVYCWLTMKDGSWWQEYSARGICMAPPTPGPGPVPAPPPAPPPTPAASSTTLGVLGILALVAVGGGSYYAWRRYKRGRR